ncbi:MAG: hypothetical protein AVDCRST_MAG64-194, partial [uncultured Phycisphaerae bacterium]
RQWHRHRRRPRAHPGIDPLPVQEDRGRLGDRRGPHDRRRRDRRRVQGRVGRRGHAGGAEPGPGKGRQGEHQEPPGRVERHARRHQQDAKQAGPAGLGRVPGRAV